MGAQGFRRDLTIVMIAGVLGIILSFAMLRDLASFGIDDANITHVYARNIAEGLGPVYYKGGPLVEGSTSTLWTLINAGLWFVSGGWPPAFIAVSITLCLLSVALSVTALHQVMREAALTADIAVWMTALILACSPFYFAWTAWSLMDVTLWAVLFTFAAIMMARYVRVGGLGWRLLGGLSAVCVLVVLTRPEGVAIVAGLIIVAMFLSALCWTGAERARRIAGLAIAGAAAGASYGALTLIRLSIFGYPFPNTYYAKVADDWSQRLGDGLAYCWDALLHMEFLAFGLVAWALILGHGAWNGRADLRLWLRNGPGLVLFPAAVLGLFATSILAGGDHFKEHRFLQPALALIAAGIGCAAALVFEALRARGVFKPQGRLAMARAGTVILAFGTFAASWYVANRHAWNIQLEFNIAQNGRYVGEQFTRMTRQSGETSVGVITAGGFALRYEGGPIYDLMGLNWPEMAHSPKPKVGFKNHAGFDPDIFYAAAPDIVLSLAVKSRTSDVVEVDCLEDKVLKGMLRSQRFRDLYAPFAYDDGREALYSFASRDWLAQNDIEALEVLRWSRINVPAAFDLPAAELDRDLVPGTSGELREYCR